MAAQHLKSVDVTATANGSARRLTRVTHAKKAVHPQELRLEIQPPVEENLAVKKVNPIQIEPAQAVGKGGNTVDARTAPPWVQVLRGTATFM